MAPCPASSIGGMQALARKKAPVRLTLMTFSHSSTGISRMEQAGRVMPALCTTASIRPYFLASATRLRHESNSPTLTRTATAWGRDAACCVASAMSAMMTVCVAAKRCAQARPMLLAAPVTMATGRCSDMLDSLFGLGYPWNISGAAGKAVFSPCKNGSKKIREKSRRDVGKPRCFSIQYIDKSV